MTGLPLDRGYPVPWFVQWFLGDQPSAFGVGRPDFRVVDSRKFARAIRQKRCWVCGEPLGKYMSFAIGPMCAINRVTSEPPSHRECAIFSVKACPFMSNPDMRRRENALPECRVEPAGVHIDRNPGVMLVWTTLSYEIFETSRSTAGDVTAGAGYLVHIGEPVEDLRWFAEGRTATPAEIMHSIDSGLPLLRNACAVDEDPQGALRELDEKYGTIKKLVTGAAA
jgi:hypothetical protein